MREEGRDSVVSGSDALLVDFDKLGNEVGMDFGSKIFGSSIIGILLILRTEQSFAGSN